MGIAPGTRLGPYEIVSAIGAGGMGEVYRARDTRLGRDVALKVLPEAFAADAGRMARFEREAKVLASLNHPNIASIYGFEESGGVRALVMELVEGPTLAERIGGTGASATYKSKGTPAGMPVPRGAIPVEEALAIARQICEGLEYAHERGIVHRDLKPANVKITPEGTAKILDFGLAKALEGEPAAGDISTSPTISRLATQAGIILGTAAYMSPEQAKGKPIDRRADIWAFGCVLYEMLTSKAAFRGETVSDVLAAVIRAEPDWGELPQATPERIRELLRRCLAKDARQRLQAIGEARIAIERAIGGPAEAEVAVASVGRERPRREILAWALVAGFALAAAGAGSWAYWLGLRAPQPAPAAVSQILPPPNASFVFAGNEAGPPAFSPDGRELVFAAIGSDGKQRLWVRQLDAAAARPLEGTDGATFPFWSPDGRSLGFFASGKLNRIDTSGGPVVGLADAPTGRGGAWSKDGTILFAPTTFNPIFRVPSSGGTPQQVTKLNASRQETSHRWPQFLPDGKHFLFYAHGNSLKDDASYVASLEGGEPELLVRGDSNAAYSPPGYLLYIRQGTLMAQRFDARSLRLTDEATPLVEHTEMNATVYRGLFTVSESGILAYEAGDSSIGGTHLLWYDRSGRQIGETGPPADFSAPAISPDGKKLAVGVFDPGGVSSIWVYDLTRGVRTRLTFAPGVNTTPVWSPDGKTIAFLSTRSGHGNLYRKPADGSGSTIPLVADDANEIDPSGSADGRYLLFQRTTDQPGSHGEVWAMPLFGDRKAFPVVQGKDFDAGTPALSPDGKWLAYMSTESAGVPQVYIAPFLHGSGKWEVSTGGAGWGKWRRDGKELFYLALDKKIVSVEIAERGAGLAIGKVQPLFQTFLAPNHVDWTWDVSADGKKFVVASPGGPQVAAPLTLVDNWPAMLKKQ